MYDIQSRWKLDGAVLRYYGLRNQPEMFKNTVKIRKNKKKIIEKLPCKLSADEIDTLKNLIGTRIVKIEHKRVIPSSPDEVKFAPPAVQVMISLGRT